MKARHLSAKMGPEISKINKTNTINKKYIHTLVPYRYGSHSCANKDLGWMRDMNEAIRMMKKRRKRLDIAETYK